MENCKMITIYWELNLTKFSLEKRDETSHCQKSPSFWLIIWRFWKIHHRTKIQRKNPTSISTKCKNSQNFLYIFNSKKSPIEKLPDPIKKKLLDCLLNQVKHKFNRSNVVMSTMTKNLNDSIDIISNSHLYNQRRRST